MAERSAGSAPDSSGDRQYKIYAAIEEEYDKGWVWIKEPHAPSRALVKLHAEYKDEDKASEKWITFCEARHIDENFLERYAAPERRRVPISLEESAGAMVISDRHRNALGGFPTDHPK